jgi:hypothetical protein
LARVHAPQYQETLFSRLYPGQQHSSPTYIPVLQALAQFLNFSSEQKQRTILRSDAGFGSDDNLNYALADQWQVLSKGNGGKRPGILARQIAPADWYVLRPDDRWVAQAVKPPTYLKPVQTLVLRWRTQTGELKHATLACSILAWSLPEVIGHYDDRGACETQIQADKGGLKMVKRRKKQLMAQEALILLTDLAHNLLAWSSRWMFVEPPLTEFGPTRLIEDIFAIPGYLIFKGEQLVEVQLNELHPHAAQVAQALARLLAHFGHP